LRAHWLHKAFVGVGFIATGALAFIAAFLGSSTFMQSFGSNATMVSPPLAPYLKVDCYAQVSSGTVVAQDVFIFGWVAATVAYSAVLLFAPTRVAATVAVETPALARRVDDRGVAITTTLCVFVSFCSTLAIRGAACEEKITNLIMLTLLNFEIARYMGELLEGGDEEGDDDVVPPRKRWPATLLVAVGHFYALANGLVSLAFINSTRGRVAALAEKISLRHGPGWDLPKERDIYFDNKIEIEQWQCLGWEPTSHLIIFTGVTYAACGLAFSVYLCVRNNGCRRAVNVEKEKVTDVGFERLDGEGEWVYPPCVEVQN
jgi:hypothetical protein